MNSTYLFFGRDAQGTLNIQSDKVFDTPEGHAAQSAAVDLILEQQHKLPSDTKFHCAMLEGHPALLYDMTDWTGEDHATQLEVEAMAAHLGLDYVVPQEITSEISYT